MALTAKQPKIFVCKPENREYYKQAKLDDDLKNPAYAAHYPKYVTCEIVEQELKKVAIDYSAQKIRGSYRYIRRVYDIVTDELLEETERNLVHHWFFDSNEIYVKEE